MAQIDPRMVAFEEHLKRLGLTLSDLVKLFQSEHPEYANIAYTTFSRWRNGETSRQNKGWVPALLEFAKSRSEKLSTSVQIPGKKQTSVYYNDEKDSVLGGLDLAALLRSQEVEAWVIDPQAEWAASAAMKKLFSVSAFPGAAGAGVVVQIKESFESFRPGVVFFMLETEYPAENVILLLESQSNPDIKRLGFVDPDGRGIKTHLGNVSLQEWRVTHYAFAFGWGIGDQVTDVFSSKLGISPKGIRETYKS